MRLSAIIFAASLLLMIAGCSAMFIVPDDNQSGANNSGDTTEPEAGAPSDDEPEPAKPEVKVRDFKDKHDGMITCVSMSPDSKFLATASTDASVKLWRISNGAEVRSFVSAENNEMNSVSFGDGGKKLATLESGGAVKLWETDTGKPLECKVKAPEGFIPISIALNPDGKSIALGGLEDARLFSVNSGEQTRTFTGHQDRVTGVEFSPDGKNLATTSRDKTVKIWDVANGTVTRSISGDQEFLDVCFQNNGAELATLGYMGKFRVFNIATGDELYVYEIEYIGVGTMEISPDGEWMALGDAMANFSISEVGQMFNWLKHK